MAAPTPITPPARVDPNAEYRFVECQDSYVLLLLQRTLDAITAQGGTDLATEATLAAIKAITDQMTFTGGDLNVNASVTLPAGLATEATLELVRLLLVSLDAKDFATEATLAEIKAKTDLLNFTGAKLRTTGEDASGGGGTSTFGDTATVSTIALTDVSATVVAANTDRKEVIIYNTTGKKVWLFFGATAVFGKGIELLKDDVWIEDRYRGQITAIMDTGETGSIEVTDVTT